MYQLAEFLHDVVGFDCEPDCKILCRENRLDETFLTNNMNDTLACYTFTIVTHGHLSLIHNGSEVHLSAGDLYCYIPGATCTIVSGTDDYRSICLLADENLTLSSPIVRLMTHATYFSIMILDEHKLALSPTDADHLVGIMRQILNYQQKPHQFKRDVLNTLYTLFLLDLMDIQERSIRQGRYSERIEQLFTDFIQLAHQHFIEHRNLAFYADRLHITPIYLSRVVKSITGDTVVAYLNRLLLMEATYQLQTTEASINQIAENLHFADQASFSKFFRRMRGMGPKEFRKR